MTETHWHIAQVNIALPREPLTSALLADFVAALAPINALADASPGFVWRLQTPDGDASGIRAFGDDRLIVNMSVWESLDALGDFVFRSAHAEVMRGRRTWFEAMREAYAALWWVPIGHRPTITEAEERLHILRTEGPTRRAFSFKNPFPPAGSAPIELGGDADCPV